MLDSRCTNHMIGERCIFSSYSPMTHLNENIVFGDNSKGDVIRLSKVAITLEHSIINVLHVDSLSYNLLSISQLCEMGYCRCFTTDSLPQGYPGKLVRASAYVELNGKRKRQSIYPGSGPRP